MYVLVSVSYILKISSVDVSVSCLYSESVLHRCQVSNVMLREGDYGGGCVVIVEGTAWPWHMAMVMGARR